MNKIFLLIMFLVTQAIASPAIDSRGNLLPGNPQINMSSEPTVTVGSFSTRLYKFGSGPAPITTFGGIKRECSRILPSHSDCYSTNPVEVNFEESSICGFPAIPSLVVACKGSSCVSEIFMYACNAAYPDYQESTYSKPLSAGNVIGEINSGADFTNQVFSSRMDYVSNLNLAVKVKKQGRVPVIATGGMLFDYDGRVKLNAAQILDDAIAKYPSVFTSDVTIELFDEPFYGHPNVSVFEKINSINLVKNLLLQRLPRASLGVAIAPTWSIAGEVVPAFESIVDGLSWVAVDPYLQSPGDEENVLTQAKQFISYMRQNHSNLQTLLIVQGFAPVFGKTPATWNAYDVSVFSDFLGRMSDVSRQYDGVMVWGWNYVNELDDAFAGKNFPSAIKDLYVRGLDLIR